MSGLSKVFLFILLLVFPFIKGYSGIINISGNAPSYKNMELTFYKISDWISGTEEVIGKCIVSDSGNFSLKANIDNTIEIHTYLGIYQGYFYTEENKNYDLVLPEKQDKSEEDKLNPFFEYIPIHLGIKNFTDDDLNMLIVMFDDAFIPYYDKHVNNIYFKPDFAKIDKDIEVLEAPFKSYSNKYFADYRRYHYGMLKLLANRQRVQSLSNEYFNNFPVLYSNTAYADLFNQVYNKYFVFFGRSDSGKKIYDDINISKSYSSLSNTLLKSHNFDNDTLSELVILKQVHDEFYGDQFSRKGLLNILDTLISKTKIPQHKKIGEIIKHKITKLLAGYEPPFFELEDTEGNFVKLTDFRGKYVYLNFCTCQSYTCLNEFNSLSLLHKKLGDKLTIITIATDPNEEVLRQFLANNKYEWKFLFYDKQPDILKDYDIRAFPTYFLIGTDGKLIFSPAVSPSENFEERLFEVMKSQGAL